MTVDMGLILKLYLIDIQCDCSKAPPYPQVRQKQNFSEQDAVDRPDRNTVPFSNASCPVLPCPALFCDVSRRWHVPHAQSLLPSFQSGFPVYFLCPLLPFFFTFLPFILHHWHYDLLCSLPCLSLNDFLPLLGVFVSVSHLTWLLFSSVSPSVSSSASVPPHPLSPPSLALSPFTSLPVANCCFQPTLRLQSKPTATGTPVTIGTHTHTHTHTELIPGQQSHRSPSSPLLLSHHILTFA